MIYEYKCICGAKGESCARMGQAKESIPCECGRQMKRIFSPLNFKMKITGREDALNALNKGDYDTLPNKYGGKKRMEDLVMAGTEEPPKQFF